MCVCDAMYCCVLLGRVIIQLSDMPNGQDDDKWHHLMTKASRTAQGSLRLVANFKVLSTLCVYNACVLTLQCKVYVHYEQASVSCISA